MVSVSNIFDFSLESVDAEVFEDIVKSEHVRVERTLSKGHSSPKDGWYDQDENEWVIVLQGNGRLVFDDGTEIELDAGDHVNLSAHKRHRVVWADPDNVTVWLAVFTSKPQSVQIFRRWGLFTTRTSRRA